MFNIHKNLAHLLSVASLDSCKSNVDNSAKNSHSPLDRTEVISPEVLQSSFLSVHALSDIFYIRWFPFVFQVMGF